MKGQISNKTFRVGLLSVVISFLLMQTYASSKTVEKGKLYFVGVGPAGPEFATLQAIEVIKQADVIFAPAFIQNAFKEYLKDKDVRVAWPENLYKVGSKPYTALDTEEEKKEHMRAVRKRARDLAEQFKKEMAQNRSVALLVNGDPCLFGDLRWFKQFFTSEEFEVIPGMSSFNAGAALLKADLTRSSGSKTVIIYSPIGDTSGEPIRELAKHKATMIFFMAGNLRHVVNELKKEYDAETPIAITYFVGYPDRQKVIKGTLNTILHDTALETEKEMLLIYVGDFMK